MSKYSFTFTNDGKEIYVEIDKKLFDDEFLEKSLISKDITRNYNKKNSMTEFAFSGNSSLRIAKEVIKDKYNLPYNDIENIKEMFNL